MDERATDAGRHVRASRPDSTARVAGQPWASIGTRAPNAGGPLCLGAVATVLEQTARGPGPHSEDELAERHQGVPGSR